MNSYWSSPPYVLRILSISPVQNKISLATAPEFTSLRGLEQGIFGKWWSKNNCATQNNFNLNILQHIDLNILQPRDSFSCTG